MKALEQEVQALLHAAQQARKAKLDHGRVDTTFQVGDQVLLRTKELLDAAEIGKLRPRWEGPFRVTALAGPNTYTLALPRRFRCSPTVNVERLKPYHPRPDGPVPPGPVLDPGQEGEYVVEQLLNRKTLRGRTYYLVRWQGHTSADDSWEPVEHLTHCPERVAEYEAAAPRRPAARRHAGRGGTARPAGPDPSAPPASPWLRRSRRPRRPPLAVPWLRQARRRWARRSSTGGRTTAGNGGSWRGDARRLLAKFFSPRALSAPHRRLHGGRAHAAGRSVLRCSLGVAVRRCGVVCLASGLPSLQSLTGPAGPGVGPARLGSGLR